MQEKPEYYTLLLDAVAEAIHALIGIPSLYHRTRQGPYLVPPSRRSGCHPGLCGPRPLSFCGQSFLALGIGQRTAPNQVISFF